MNEAMKQHFEDFIARRKEDLLRMREERAKSQEIVSGVVVASRIANALINGNVKSDELDSKSNMLNSDQVKELSETVQYAELMKDDIDVVTIPPQVKLQPGKKIVINLPGNGTSLTDNDGNPFLKTTVTANAKRGLDSFFDFIDHEDQLKRKDFQTVACYYTFKRNGLIEDFNEHGIPHEGIERFACVFDDLVSKNGQKIALNDAVSNMKNVVLRGQCFGTLVVSELEEILKVKLAVLGYTDEECAQILSAPTALFSSSPVALDKQPKHFKVVAYANCADTLIPTIKGSPVYKDVAGFTDEEIKSDNFQMKEIKLRENYQLLLCSRLDMPETEELLSIIRHKHEKDTAYQIELHRQKAEKGHDFGYVSHIMKKDSPFMQVLQRSLRTMMLKPVQHINVRKMLDDRILKRVSTIQQLEKFGGKKISRRGLYARSQGPRL